MENKGILGLLVAQLTEFCNPSNTNTQLMSANLPSVCSHPVCKRWPGKHPPSQHPVLSEHSSLLTSLETICSFPRQGPQGQALVSPGTSAGKRGQLLIPILQAGKRVLQWHPMSLVTRLQPGKSGAPGPAAAPQDIAAP